LQEVAVEVKTTLAQVLAVEERVDIEHLQVHLEAEPLLR
jgi:hypothetical protein